MCERPEKTSTDEIEITPEMIAAGLRALDEAVNAYPESLLVKEVYRAMRLAELHHSERALHHVDEATPTASSPSS